MTNNTPDYNDNLYFDAQNTKNEQQKDLYIKVEKQVWESTLNRSMVLEADNKRLKHDVGNLGYKIKNQRHEIERQIAQNKELKDEIRFLKEVGTINEVKFKPFSERLLEEKLSENKKLKELLKRVNEHFKWVDHDDPFYVKDELWDDIKKLLENNNEVLK